MIEFNTDALKDFKIQIEHSLLAINEDCYDVFITNKLNVDKFFYFEFIAKFISDNKVHITDFGYGLGKNVFFTFCIR
jgi:hypothetical protein